MNCLKKRTLTRRTRGSTAGNELETTYFKRKQGTSTTTTSYYSRYKEFNSWYFVGWDIPCFHSRRRKGELMPMTDFKMFKHHGSSFGTYDLTNSNSSPETTYWCEPSNGYRSFQDWEVSELDLHDLYVPESYDAYLQHAAAKIYGNGHDTLTFLAELADVKRLFINAGKSLLKGGLPLGWQKMSGAWLSTRYGWRTLMYDLEDLNKALSNLNGERTRYSESAGDTYSFSNNSAWETDAGNGTRGHSWNDQVTIGIRGSVVADVDIPQFQFNPLVTGWELIPFSFVVDWFITVGKTLAAWSFLSLQPKYVSAAGYSVKVRRDYSMETISWNDGWSGDNEQTGFMEAELRVRSPMRIPFLPRFVLNLNNFKIVDLVALVIQRLK